MNPHHFIYVSGPQTRRGRVYGMRRASRGLPEDGQAEGGPTGLEDCHRRTAQSLAGLSATPRELQSD